MNAHEQWLLDRMTGIGGSDAPAVLGLSKYKTPFEVYQEKRGEIAPIPDNENMLWGRVLEPVIRQQYAERNNVSVLMPEKMLRHPKYEFMVANIDGFTDNNRILEVKTARSSNDWGDSGTDQIPQTYLIQVQHYLIVTGCEVADVAALIGGSDYRQYTIEADKELQELIIEGELLFWENLQHNIAPPPISFNDAMARYGKHSEAGEVTATQEVEKAVNLLRSIKDQYKALEEAEAEAKATVMKHMQTFDTLVSSNGKTLVTWKEAKATERFDSARFKLENPALYDEYIKMGDPSRRFLIK